MMTRWRWCNAVEFVLGGDKDTNDLDRLPVLDADGTNMTFNFVCDRASIDPSVTIIVGTNLTTWPDVFTVGADTANCGGVSVPDNLDGTHTVKLNVPHAPSLP